MIEEEALAQLLANSKTHASINNIALWRATIEEASEIGARRALARLGLADVKARNDIGDLRELLGTWRDAKRSAHKAVIDWIVRGALAALMIGLVVKMGLIGLLR